MTREFPKNNSPENTSPQIALPTVGRIVLYYHVQDGPKGYPAIVVETVDGSHTIITMHAFLPDGTRLVAGVRHKSANEPLLEYWDWMDYQKGQAAKTEALEAQIKNAHFAGPSVTGLRSHPDELSKLQAGAPSPVDGKR